MGWFWTEKSASPATMPHPLSNDLNKTPPAGCPMHVPSASTSSSPSSKSPITSSSGGCPVIHDKAPASPDHSSSIISKLNPLNYMPSLPQTRAPNQPTALPVEREVSSIPRGDVDSNWEYPSPQQMYNAMLRKGKAEDTPIDAVESMVAVHNFLNEGAWGEIEAWEARFSRGLGFGWRTCRRGEEHFADEYRAAKREPGWSDLPAPRLARFIGRPAEMTPKARVLQTLGLVAPSYRSEPPFDRHDWYVQRRSADGQSEEVRYVIDYYSAPLEATGEPVFYLDVRPALDTPSAAVARMMRWGGDVWYRASGGITRE